MNKSSEDIKNIVLKKIRQGNIHMRPRIYFIIQIILVIAVALVALIASTFVISFTFFSIHESGELFLLGFGIRGLFTFLSLFPRFTLLVTIILIFILEWLLRHFKFNYRVPILNMFLITLLTTLIIGLLVVATPIHTSLLDKADKGELPIIGELYENIHIPHENNGEFRGVIISIATSTITITHNDRDSDTDDGVRTVLVPQGFDVSRLHMGDRIYVAGSIASSTITAYGLSKF